MNNHTIWPKIRQRFPEANMLQSPEWGHTNELIGHKVIIENFSTEAWALMIVKDARRGRYLEVPGGPLLDWADHQLAARMLARIKVIAREQKCAFVRLRPQVLAQHAERLAGLGLRQAPMHLHAEHTIILDLEQDETALMNAMRRQTRYEVRRADKLGITVDCGNSAELFREFQCVQAQTATRQHFVPPDLTTLLAEHEAFGDNAMIYVARTGTDNHPAATPAKTSDQTSQTPDPKIVTPTQPPDSKTPPSGAPIAYGLILISGAEADYFEAASTPLNQRLPGAYALQWRVIRDLKKQGIKRYNLWGIAPAGSKSKHHRYAGVTTFKSGFGGKLVEYVPAQDLVISPLRYVLNGLVETLRKKKRHL